jgi:VWFA-related protein
MAKISNRAMRFVAALLFLPVWAQQQPGQLPTRQPGQLPSLAPQASPERIPPQQRQDTPDTGTTTFRSTVKVVLAPTTVMDRSGNVIGGLNVTDFKLYDNDKLQRLSTDVSFHPISIVVAIQANSTVSEILPKIQKIGSVIGDMVVGGNGEAAVLAFDHRMRVIQDFTNDSAQISDAFKKVKPGSSTSAMIDAVQYSINMLRKRPDDHRRIVLLISETGDKGSEGHVREVLDAAQIYNIVIYSVNISHVVSLLTDKGMPPAPSPIPPTATVGHPGAPMTPTTISQNRDLGNFVPAFVEIFKAAKGIFVSNPAEVLTRFTGGREYSFIKQEALESDLVHLGQELHNQYLLSYQPNNLSEGGYHKIQVVVDRPDLEVRTRPGYWKATEPGN